MAITAWCDCVINTRFLLSLTPPQYEDHPRLLRGNQLDNTIGESFPTTSMMGMGLTRPDRENRVEHEHTLSWPRVPDSRY